MCVSPFLKLSYEILFRRRPVFSLFSELKGKKLWITGESYAGMFTTLINSILSNSLFFVGTYIPYIADTIYNRPSLKTSAGINLQGIAIFDRKLFYFLFGE